MDNDDERFLRKLAKLRESGVMPSALERDQEYEAKRRIAMREFEREEARREDMLRCLPGFEARRG